MQGGRDNPSTAPAGLASSSTADARKFDGAASMPVILATAASSARRRSRDPLQKPIRLQTGTVVDPSFRARRAIAPRPAWSFAVRTAKLDGNRSAGLRRPLPDPLAAHRVDPLV